MKRSSPGPLACSDEAPRGRQFCVGYSRASELSFTPERDDGSQRFPWHAECSAPHRRKRVMRHLGRLTVLGTGLLLVTVGCVHREPAGSTTTTLPTASGTPVV